MVGSTGKGYLAHWLAAAGLGAALLVGCEPRDDVIGNEQAQPSEPMGQTSSEQQRTQEQSAQQQGEPMSPLGRAQAQEPPEPAPPVPFEQEEQARVEEQPSQTPEVEELQQPQPVEPEQQQRAQQQAQPETPEPPGGRDEAALIRGTVEGTARSIDLARGTVTIESSGQEVTLQAHPSDLARIQAGDQVALGFTSYPDGSQWIQPSADPSEVLERSDSVGQLQGQIEAIDEDAGIVAVAGQTFRAHPDQLEALEPGESVSVSFAEVEDTPWVAELETSQQDRVAQAEPQPEPLDEEHTASDIDWEFIN